MKYRILIAMLAIVLVGVGCECAMGQGWVRQNDFYGDTELKFYVDDVLMLTLDLDSADFTQGIYAPSYHGTSDIFLKEDGIFFGINDSANMFIDTDAVFGDAWTLCTDNVHVKQLIMESSRVLIDTSIGPTPGTITTLADETSLRFKMNSRPWLEASWDDREVRFGGDIYPDQNPLPFRFLSGLNNVDIATIDGFNATITLHGDIILDPENSSHWSGVKTLVIGKLAFTQEDGNEYIDSLADARMHYGATFSHNFMVGGNPVLELRAMIAQFWTTIIDLPKSARIRWNSGDQQILEVGGKLRIGAQGSDGYVRMDGESGDVEMVGGSLCFVDPNGGMIEGGMSGYNEGITLTSVAAGDWDKIEAFTANEPSNVIDPNYVDDHIHITKDGRYGCEWRWSGHGTAVAHDWEIMVFKDDGDVGFTNTASRFTNPTTQKDITVPGGGKILCEDGDVIDMRVRRTTPGNNILFTTDMCRLYVVLTGGL